MTISKAYSWKDDSKEEVEEDIEMPDKSERSDSSIEEKQQSTENEEEEDINAPVDKMNLVYFIFFLNGIGVLLPWNMFITIAPDYYVKYWFTTNGTETHYGTSFMSALGITSQIPNWLMSIINVTAIIGGPLMFRIMGPLALNAVQVIVILAMAAFVNPTTGAMHWFYVVNLIIVMVMNASNGLYQNSMFGLAADFPNKYTNALVVGNNICGTFTSLLSICTTLAINKEKAVAIIYFSISLLVLVLCGVSLYAVSRMEFYQYYTRKGDLRRQRDHSTRPSLMQFWETFKSCWYILGSIFLVYFVTLSVFPTILVGIVPWQSNLSGHKWNSPFPEKVFAGITTFLNFNLFASVGSTTASFIQFPGPKLLPFPVISRLVFIPFFMFCNYVVDGRTLTVIFKSEWWFFFGNTIMAFTSGYFSSLGLMYAPSIVPPHLSKIAGMASALSLVTGIMAGVGFTPLITKMVQHIG